MIKVLIKFIIAAAIIPVAIGTTIAFYSHLILIKELAANLKFFVWGVVTYTVLHLLFYKPTYLYVLGHEAVHAGMAWIFGGKIKSFKVSDSGGSVKTDKSNFVIELSPYFVPIYAIIITVVYFVIASSYAINGSIFVFLIAFALTFHIISTIEIMKIKQPDIIKSGYLFSILLVYTLNLIVISLIFSLIFPAFSVKNFFIDIWLVSKDIYLAAVRQLFF
ncbi:MAG: hypothetical protein HZA72_00615 [Candidatus Omnitrophica bacterium]|nr:hypothetical protein [Candidatus Omnitrophota bacterium]